MIVASLFFYLFAAVTVASAFMVITARNPVHAVLFLILCFFSAAGLFLLLGAEFLAMVLVIVYVGAVAVLFLFVVMMLDVDFAELRAGFIKYLPIGAIIGLVMLAELGMVLSSWVLDVNLVTKVSAPMPKGNEVTNTEALGRILYTDYVFFFEAAGMILLVAMIGAIVLTLRHKEGVKRQSVPDQVGRTPATAIEIKQVESGKGI